MKVVTSLKEVLTRNTPQVYFPRNLFVRSTPLTMAGKCSGSFGFSLSSDAAAYVGSVASGSTILHAKRQNRRVTRNTCRVRCLNFDEVQCISFLGQLEEKCFENVSD